MAGNDLVVGVFHSAAGNMAAAVKLEHIHDFLEGKHQWTACRDYDSPNACLEAAIEATTQAAEAGDVLAQFQLGKESGLPGHIEWLILACLAPRQHVRFAMRARRPL